MSEEVITEYRVVVWPKQGRKKERPMPLVNPMAGPFTDLNKAIEGKEMLDRYETRMTDDPKEFVIMQRTVTIVGYHDGRPSYAIGAKPSQWKVMS